MRNIYYSPEFFGLQVVDSWDVAGAYEFDMFVIWKDDKGRFYWGTDSGCSCPSPFENVGTDDLASGSYQDAMNDYNVWQNNN